MSPCHLFEHFKDKCIKAVLKNLYVIRWAEVSSWHCFLTLQKILMGGKISHWKQWGINRSLRLLGADSSQLCPTMLTASRPVFKKQKCCCACGLGSSGFWLGCFFFFLLWQLTLMIKWWLEETAGYWGKLWRSQKYYTFSKKFIHIYSYIYSHLFIYLNCSVLQFEMSSEALWQGHY